LWYSTHPADACDENGTLKMIHLDDTGLQGTLPIELSLLSNGLERLYLSSNNLRGTIPFEYGQLTKLECLKLINNHLSGSLPSELSQMSNLVVLGLGRNQIGGTLPSQLGDLSSLSTLDLEGNQFVGTIPTEFANLTGLEYMSFESNRLYGSIPTELGRLPVLSSLTVHRNQLTGVMPLQLCPSGEFMTTLTADCEEVQCECCTECCIGCNKDTGDNPYTDDLVGMLLPVTALPSQAPTVEQSALWASDVPSSIPSDVPSTIPSEWASDVPSTIPSDLPSLIPSTVPTNAPSILPTMVPTPCRPKVIAETLCYLKDTETAITVSFEKCDNEKRDWIGLFAFDGEQRLKSEAELWVRTCGSQFCNENWMTGNVTLGGDGWPLIKGEYRVYLVRGEQAYAMTETIWVDKKCDW
jgi:hypothetical protein